MTQSAPLLIKLIANSVKCATKAGYIIKETLKTGNLNIVEKGNNDLQTEADRSAQRCIVNSLNRNFPNIKIIGEETLDDKTPMKDEWVINDLDENVLSKCCPKEFVNIKDEEIVIWVDPLDGTFDYAQGFLEYVTVLIGIAVNGKAIAGVIHQPYHNYQVEKDEKKIGRTIWGLVGLGAFGYNNKIKNHQESSGKNFLENNNIHDTKNQFVITTTKSHSNKQIDSTLEILKPSKVIRAGGAGYKGLLVLEKTADIYFYPAPGCKRWDTCAPNAIIKSIGGLFTDIHGKEYSYDKNVNYNNYTGVLACRSTKLHDWVVNNIPPDVKRSLNSQL